MASEPVRVPESIRFGEDFELDHGAFELRRAGSVLKVERIPMEVLLFLIEQRGRLVTRDEIVERVWGKDVFLDTDNSINGAVRKIRQILKDDPENPRFIQTVTGKGYRFIAPVAAPESSAPQASVAPLALLVPAQPRQSAPRRWQVALAVGVLLIGAAAAYLLWPRLSGRTSLAGHRVMLAVLPFRNLTGDAAQEYVSDGLTEEMISQLGDLDPSHLGVIARTSVMHYKGSQASLEQIGRELGVQYVIEGSIRRDSERIRISAQLIQMKDQSHVWARQYDRELKDLLAVQGEIGREIADEIQLTFSDRHVLSIAHRTAASVAASSEAYDLYLRGLYFWNNRDLRKAVEYFDRAIVTDPKYARAYAGLANSYGLMSTTWRQGSPSDLMPKARAAALHALQLDETVTEAHVALALVAESYDYDWPTAGKEFRRAIELNPNYATAHQWYGEYLSWMGRFDEALAESERARQLDPMSLIVASDRGYILYRARQYDRAISQARSVLEMDPNFGHAVGFLLDSYMAQRRFPEALDVINRYIRPKSEGWAQGCEATIYGKSGRHAEAEQALTKFEKLVPSDDLGREYGLMGISMAMGRNDRAIAILQKLFTEHSHIITGLKVDPVYDSLRSDPRFQDLLWRAGFSQ